MFEACLYFHDKRVTLKEGENSSIPWYFHSRQIPQCRGKERWNKI